MSRATHPAYREMNLVVTMSSSSKTGWTDAEGGGGRERRVCACVRIFGGEEEENEQHKASHLI